MTVAGLCLLVVMPVQLVSVWLLLNSVTVALENIDPFAGVDMVIPHTPFQDFTGGFAMSLAASFGSVALLSCMRLVQPYRNRSLRVVQAGSIAHITLVLATLAGVLLGNRGLTSGVIGTMLSLVYVIPVLSLSFNRVIKAWSVVYVPPLPPLPGDAGAGAE